MMEQRKKHTTFITGADGFIGQMVVRRMIEKTSDKLILNCRKPDQHTHESERIANSRADLLDEDSLLDTLETFRPDHIIHLAALSRLSEGEKEPDKTFQTNYLSTVRLIHLAEKFKVKKFIFVSSDLANNPLSVVGLTKYLAESYIQTKPGFHVSLITLRFPNISYSPGSVHQIFEHLIREDKPLTVTDPAMTRRFISSTEAADYLLFVFKTGKSKDIYVINKKPVSILSLAEQMISLSGKNLPVEIIGKRPGEKLEEMLYKPGEVKPVQYNDLAILLKKDYSIEIINECKEKLKLKTSFTLLEELENI
jgi:FlaA1/EpsC-like NDP-sugar epimerase